MNKLLAPWPILIALGAGVGFIAGLFGVGGGFLLSPLLRVALNVPWNIAVGTTLATTTLTALAAAITHRRLGGVNIPVAALLLAGSLPAVFLGVAAHEALERTAGGLDLWLSLCYIAALTAIGAGMIRESGRSLRSGSSHVRTPLAEALQGWRCPPVICVRSGDFTCYISGWPVLAAGAMLGFIAGLLGIGGGPFLVPALIYILGLPTQLATGTSLAAICVTAAFAAFKHFTAGNVSILSALAIGAGSILGARSGAIACHRLDAARVRWLFGLLTLAVAASVAAKMLLIAR